VNLYGFASGDPVNFSDPLGLCKNRDPECWRILAMLREQKGDVFRTAARAFEVTNREVHLVPGDHERIPFGFMNRDGNPRTFVGGYTPQGGDAMWLNADLMKGDLLLVAVDEADHLMGRFHPAGTTSETDPRAFARMEKAYGQMSPGDQTAAPLHSDALHRRTNGRVGMPLPPDYTEPQRP
jgi:hypothetical protein